jgi:hypothetical protein
MSPDNFYFPTSFVAGVLISIMTVGYMTVYIFSLLSRITEMAKSRYGNVYDKMFEFFRNG